MYIKQIRSKKTENGGSVVLYYVLCVYDTKRKVWAERYISNETAKNMIIKCNISFKEIYTSIEA